MPLSQLQSWCWVFLCAVLLLPGSVLAGGPILFDEATGTPLPWLEDHAVFHLETGALGALSNAEAVQIVREMFQVWADVPTARLTVQAGESLGKDITVEDVVFVDCGGFLALKFHCDAILRCISQGMQGCISPVAFDGDGSMFDLLFGPDSGVIGVSGILVSSIPGDPVPPFKIINSWTILNGDFVQEDSDTARQNLRGLVLHEAGHFLGLAHSSVNGDLARLSPIGGGIIGVLPADLSPTAQVLSPIDSLVTPPSDTKLPAGLSAMAQVLHPIDSLVTPSFDTVETMYPFLLADSTGVNTASTPEQDDRAAISALYPCTPETITAAKCSAELSATMGTITGRVFLQNGAPAQGVLVTARRVDDPTKSAVSQLSGATFAPRRCNAILDLNGDGVGDIRGLFGPCTMAGSRDECNLTNLGSVVNKPRPPICGFFVRGSSRASLARPIPADEENLFVLQGLAPGEYMVQASQVIAGRFASPVRSSFTPAPVIRSDDNTTFVFFPNPQTGEFYNGPATGCADPSSCGSESGNSLTDNPFAFTRIHIKAGETVNNINLTLNTGIRLGDVESDPGFDFCGLGDVNGDKRVDTQDIQTVLNALESTSGKADINQDGIVSYMDVSIITDLVTHQNIITRAMGAPFPSPEAFPTTCP